MYNESAISIFKKLPETKEQVKDYHKLIRQSVLDGEVNSLDFAAQITALEQLFKALKQDPLIKDCVLEEAEKHGSKSFEKGNAKFQVKETGVRFDFTNCDDLEWFELDDKEKEIKAKKKNREAFLKAIEPEMEVYGSDGVQLKPAVKTSTTSVAVILK
jgi:hypothetical protein